MYHEYAIAAIGGVLVAIIVALISGYAKLPFDVKALINETSLIREEIRTLRARVDAMMEQRANLVADIQKEIGGLRSTIERVAAKKGLE